MFKTQSDKIREPFARAYHSLWDDTERSKIEIEEQIDMFHKKFNIHISNVTYSSHSGRIWDVEFENEGAYVLFMLEWA